MCDPDLPVHRPPLSKEYLHETLEKVFVHPAGYYEAQNIEVRTRTGVGEIDRGRHDVVLDGGERIGYDTLVLATGARPRKLPVSGGDLPGVHYLRSLSSSQKLQAAYLEAEQAVVLGAGFTGMEIASTLTQPGVQCTVVEMGSRGGPRWYRRWWQSSSSVTTGRKGWTFASTPRSRQLKATAGRSAESSPMAPRYRPT